MGLVSMVAETGPWVVVSLGHDCLQGTFSGLEKTPFEDKFEKCLSGLECGIFVCLVFGFFVCLFLESMKDLMVF